MNRAKRLTCTVAALLCMVLLAGCSKTQQASASTPLSPSSVDTPVSSAVSSAPSASSQEAPSLPPSAEQPPESGSAGQTIPIETSDKNFNVLFAKNPLDTAYVKENDQAVSTVEMIQISEKYSALWKKEVQNAYDSLLKTAPVEKQASIKQEQQKWEQNLDAQIEKISTEAQNAGGSLAQLDASSKRMELYRTRAAEVYQELYQYKKELSFAYGK